MIDNILIELAVLIGFGLILAGIASLLKQPLIIGYIAAGILLGSNFLNIVKSPDTINTFSQLGVAFLLFMVGLNLSPKVFRSVGKISIMTGLGQVMFTSLVGFVISQLLGYDIITSLYIAIALTFSSTIIIMKILSDKNDIDTLYGKISIGFLIVQDVVAMVILAVVSSLAPGNSNQSFGIMNFAIIAAVIVLLIPITLKIFPKLLKMIAKSSEYLLIFSIGWCLILAALFHKLHFSMEIGALLAGITFSMSPYRHHVASILKPLRDFFIFLFFIFLGTQMSLNNIGDSVVPIIIFSLFILIGNPLIVLIIMGRMGYSKKTGFMAGWTVAQISEFSLILIALGIRVGHLTPEILSMITIVGLITITGSTYAMIYSDKIYPRLAGFLSIFERKKQTNQKNQRHGQKDIVLIGYDKLGYSLVKSFKDNKSSYLVVDFNPEVIKHLDEEKMPNLYGDVEDSFFLDELSSYKPKIVISTVPDYELSCLITQRFKAVNNDTIVILVSNGIEDALKLYSNGASYVIVPRFLSGEHAAKMIEKNGFDINKYLKHQVEHIDIIGNPKDIKHFAK